MKRLSPWLGLLALPVAAVALGWSSPKAAPDELLWFAEPPGRRSWFEPDGPYVPGVVYYTSSKSVAIDTASCSIPTHVVGVGK